MGIRLFRVAFVLGFLVGTSVQAAAPDVAASAAIPPESLTVALTAFAKTTGLQIVYLSRVAEGVQTRGAPANLAPAATLQKLLEGTGLQFKFTNPTTVTIFSPGEPRPTGNASPHEQETSNAAAGIAPSAEQGPPSATPGTAAAPSVPPLETVVVVGSRLQQSVKDSPVPINVYSRQQIDQTGASSVSDFLDTLPEVSLQTTTTGGSQQFGGATTVQLRGLPAGTTLVLINGRRMESASGLTGGSPTGSFFDLGSIPLAAVERIEVLPSGSSAIYGGDALGGIVNIVLKQDYEGIEADARYGWTGDHSYSESQYSLAGGLKGSNWSVSAIGTFGNNSELSGSERAITANGNYVPFGGIDTRSVFTNPGNVCTADGSNLTGLNAPCAAIPAGSTGIGLTPASFARTAGVSNLVSTSAYSAILAPSRHFGFYLQGHYDFSDYFQVFAEALYSHTDLNTYQAPPPYPVDVPATNAFNPFGQEVLVNYRFNALGRDGNSDSSNYVRPLLGFRGKIGERWNWEVAAWDSKDTEQTPQTYGLPNPVAIENAVNAGTFNPFQDGPGATTSLLRTFFAPLLESESGESRVVSGFLRGSLVDLPAGPVQAVIGGEYQRDSLGSDIAAFGPTGTFELSRHNEAGYAEVKVPLLGNHSEAGVGDILSAQFAVRQDHYSDFGSRTSPAVGLEFRPIPSFMLRGSYSTAFKPPQLYDEYAPLLTLPNVVIDPKRGNQQEFINLTFGGNPALRAETGWSRNLGFVFTPESIPGLDITMTDWEIHLSNGFLRPSVGTLLNNEDAFPGHVVRAPPGPGDPYPVGPILQIFDTDVNFGFIDEGGIDLAVRWRTQTAMGEFEPSLSVTDTYQYNFELDPSLGLQSGLSQANSTANYAPRWKGTLALNWKYDALELGVAGRYTGPYKDVTDLTPTPRTLGNFWYVDLNGRYDLGQSLFTGTPVLSKSFVAGGVRNVLNKLPPYSDYNFGLNGYDANIYSLQGRLLWVQLGVRL